MRPDWVPDFVQWFCAICGRETDDLIEVQGAPICRDVEACIRTTITDLQARRRELGQLPLELGLEE